MRHETQGNWNLGSRYSAIRTKAVCALTSSASAAPLPFSPLLFYRTPAAWRERASQIDYDRGQCKPTHNASRLTAVVHDSQHRRHFKRSPQERSVL